MRTRLAEVSVETNLAEPNYGATTKRIACLLGAVIAALAMTACERSQVAGPDNQGRYQGKHDTAPWDNEQFKGDKLAWERAIKERTQG
jgi:hypothetical protein